MKKLHTNIANNLRDIRQNEKKWHQNAMAEFLGVSTKYYNQMENGKANLTLNKIEIEDIAKKLEKDSPDIAGASDTKHIFNNISHNQVGGETKMENFQGTDKEIISYLLAQNQILMINNQELTTYIKELMQVILKER